MSAYHRPASLDQALAIRAGADVAVLAGGTDIIPARTARAAWGDPPRQDVLDISAIPGLNRVETTETGWRIGCLVTWSGLLRAGLPPLFDGLCQAAREVGGAQVQNRGTLAGNLVTASPAGDGIPNLLALAAKVELASAEGRRILPLAHFLTGYRATALRRDELLVAVQVPRLDGAQGGFRKLGARRYLVISIAMAAGVVALDGQGRIRTARLALGACSAVAQRLPALEAALRGVTLAEAAQVPQAAHLDGLAPIDDIRASAAYRRDAALVLLRDLLAGMPTP
ncbi:FAD binding domain-containing protein [Falsiroseomonas selenitidurans]|uniref:FAD-binding molybdopterin dehydrogenase n=1 Tax=Falsiroseomonas selenitidurans TaxID=2716335 RepID=A0ABX1E7I0_9PROT|nr:FAD binding domain-containing protein [Falsiroseomonas selenitidurans]NKC33179.1 FAD-binding molybdopterin dehydrogenase [Falsiroseomonas selenitidurans]